MLNPQLPRVAAGVSPGKATIVVTPTRPLTALSFPCNSDQA